MAERKRRTFTTAEKLEKVEAQISEVEETLKQLKAQKKELLEKKKQLIHFHIPVKIAIHVLN